MNTATEKTTDREIVLTRLINAPRELVWKAWTDPKHVDKWWGPNGFTNDTKEISVKPSGQWRFMMNGPNEMKFPNRITFSAVVKPERLVYEHGSDDDNDPYSFHVMVTFEDRQGKTFLTMRSVFKTAEQRKQVVEEFGALEGGLQHLNNLEEHLTGMDEKFVFISREFNAPRELVWKAWTDAEQLNKWYAPSGCKIRFESLDFREGGEYLSCITIPDGKECWCAGTYLEIDAPNRFVQTMVSVDEHGKPTSPAELGMDPQWPMETTLTITFDEVDGRTKMTLYQTVSRALAARTGAYPSWLMMFDNLDAELKK